MDKLVEIIFKKMELLPTSIGYIASGIAAIGALFYVGHRVWQSMIEGKPIEPYSLLRPAVVAIIIFAFPTFVITPIHYILSPTRTATAQMIYERKDANKAKLDKIKESVEAQRAVEAEAAAKKALEAGGEQGLLSWSIGDILNSFGRWLKEKLVAGLLMLLEVIRLLMAMFFKLLRIVFLVILGCIGPIALAMSLFPSYENSFGGWLSKYIGIYMWLPLCNILEIVSQEIDFQMMTAVLGGSVFPSEAGLSWLMILMAVVVIFAYLQIPDMAGWIIQGGSITLQAMTGAMAMAGGVAGAAGGAVGGYAARKTGVAAAWKSFKNSKVGRKLL